MGFLGDYPVPIRVVLKRDEEENLSETRPKNREPTGPFQCHIGKPLCPYYDDWIEHYLIPEANGITDVRIRSIRNGISYSLLFDEKELGRRVIGCSLRLRSRKIEVLGCQCRNASRSSAISGVKKCATRSSAMISLRAQGI